MDWKAHVLLAFFVVFLVFLFLLGARDAFFVLQVSVFAAVSALLPDLDNHLSKGREIMDKLIVFVSMFIAAGFYCGSPACFLSFDNLKSILVFTLALVGVYFLFFTFLKPAHRGITHSLLLSLIYAAIVYVLFGFDFALAGFLGYVSHLAADREVKLL